eukprot:Lankesteria_metandrocarpae@DN3985_c0_g1_i1.p1
MPGENTKSQNKYVQQSVRISDNDHEDDAAASVHTPTTQATSNASDDLVQNYNHSAEEIAAVLSFAQLFTLHENLFALDRLLSTLALLRLCNYSFTDSVLIMSVAACQLFRVMGELSGTEPKERVNIIMLQMFIAHSWLMDAACPLKEWHTHLFHAYCSFSVTNDGLVKLLQLQRFCLRVEGEHLKC